LVPDLSIYLEISADAGLERKQRRKNGELLRGVEWNRLDAREVAYHRRVADGYRALIDADPARWRVCDARLSIPDLADLIYQQVHPHLHQITRIDAPNQ